MTRVAVVGGGITGLSAARRLRAAGLEVVVLEAGHRWGGKLDAVTIDGVRLDTGAESVLARRPEATDLITELGLDGDRRHPSAAKPRVYVEGRLEELPPSVMGVPVDLDRLGSVLSAEGLARARREPEIEAPALPRDLPIGRYVDQRFGPEVTDRLVEPLLGGVYAGQARNLSFEAVSHALYERARHGGSLLEHARGTVRPGSGPVFAGLVGGVSGLVDALVAELTAAGVELRTDVSVRALERTPGGGFRLTCGPVPTPEVVSADAVLLAVPATAAGRLLSPTVAGGRDLAQIPYASMAVVTLVVRGLQSAASGVLVPPGQLPTIKAFTHSSAKWEWLGEQAAATWGDDVSVVRASVGRLGEAALLQVDDAALVERTVAEARTVPGWAGTELLASRVTRWGGALPQYLVGHRAFVAELQEDVATVPGLAVAGAMLDGVGIAACLGSAAAAASTIVADLAGVAGSGSHSDEKRAGR